MTDLATQESNDEVGSSASMDDTIRAALDSIKSRESEEVHNPQIEHEDSATTERLRGPDGKFAKTDKPVEQNVEPVKTEEPVAEDQKQEQQVSKVQPPSSWKGTAKAKFASLDPEIQQEVLRREDHFHKGLEQYKQAAQYGEAIYKAIRPYENTIRQLGVTPDVAIQALFSADHALRNGSPADKAKAFADLAKGYGIDLSQGLPEQQVVDPNVQYLQTQLQQTQYQLNQILAARQQEEELARQREQAELNSTIEQAKQGKPHFDEVRNEMAALLQAGTATDLNQAYEMAVWARPDLRQSLLAQQLAEKQAEEAKKRAEEAQKAKAAKQASSMNVPRRGTLPAQKPVGTMDDTIREALAQIRSR